MGGNVDLQFVGLRWERDPPRVRILIRDTSKKVELIQKRILTAESRQKSYADKRRRPLKFEAGDHVFLKVMHKRGVVRFDKQGKLLLRFIGPFEVLERVGAVAYRLALSSSLSSVHEVFHISMLRKYTPDSTRVLDWESLLLMQMGPSRRDLCIFWIAEIRFCDARL